MKRISLAFIICLCCLLSVSMIAIAQKEVTLQFMGWEASPLETASIKAGLTQFMKENPGIKVEYIPVAEDQYISKLLTMMVGKAAPDIFFIYAEGHYRDFQKRGVLLDVTDYFYESTKLEEFIPIERQKMVINGRIYGISSCVVAPILYYNKDLFDQAGLPYPPSDPEQSWTWEEFVGICQKLTITKGNRTEQYGVFGFEVIHPREALIATSGGKFFNDSYTKTIFDQPAQDTLQKILDLRLKYKVSPPANFQEQSGMSGSQMLQTGRVAMVADGSWALQELAKMDFRLGVGVLPKIKQPATTGTSHLHAIWKETKHPEEAWKLLKFLSSEEYQIQLIKAGLWMPNRTSLYTEAGIKRWFDPEVHPEGFEKIAPYFVKYLSPHPSLFINREAWDTMAEEFERFLFDNQPMNKVAPSLIRRVDEKLSK